MDELTPVQKQMILNWYYDTTENDKKDITLYFDMPDELIEQIDKRNIEKLDPYLWDKIKKYIVDTQIKDGYLNKEIHKLLIR